MKKFCVFILSIAITLSIAAVFSGCSNSANSEALQDSIDKIQSDSSLSDYDKLSLLTNEFFKAKEENYKSNNKVVDLSPFMCKNGETKILSHFANERSLRIDSDLEIISDNLDVEIDSIEIIGDTATVTLYEDYTYQTSLSELESFRGTEYTLHFEKVSDEWLISKVDSNDETYN